MSPILLVMMFKIRSLTEKLYIFLACKCVSSWFVIDAATFWYAVVIQSASEFFIYDIRLFIQEYFSFLIADQLLQFFFVIQSWHQQLLNNLHCATENKC